MRLTIIFFLFLLKELNAQNVQFDWALDFGDSNHCASQACTIDFQGNSLIGGFFYGNVDFDPDTSNLVIASKGGPDCFVSKFDEKGKLVWVKSIGGIAADNLRALDVDIFGNVYLAGTFSGTVDFDPNTSVFNLTSKGLEDGFVCKLDKNGAFVWAFSLGSSLNNDAVVSLNCGENGRLHCTGIFGGQVDFDPSSNFFNLSANGTSNTFILEMDTNSTFYWATANRGSGISGGYSIKEGKNGSVYLGGCFEDTMAIQANQGLIRLNSNGKRDAFIQKIDSAGSTIWAKSFGGIETDWVVGLEVDSNDNVYSVGHFGNTIDFDPGLGTHMKTARGDDYFISKLDSSGLFQWAQTFGSAKHERAHGIDLFMDGSIIITGLFHDSLDFNPSGSVNYEYSEGSSDAFIHKLNLNGNYLWSMNVGGMKEDRGLSISSDNYGKIILVGYFNDTVDFDPDTSEFKLYTKGINQNGFLLSIRECIPTFFFDTIVACDQYTWIDGLTYTMSNTTAKDTLVNASGCDSIVTLNLKINTSTTGIVSITACDSYKWIDGVTYISSNNTAKDTLVNSNGCDSIVTLNLIINTSTTGIDTVTACNSFKWINGVTYTSGNTTAKDTLVNANGCDSIVRLNLTINTINDSVINRDSKELVAFEKDAQYQWLNCRDNFKPILGDTLIQSKSVEGSFAVEIRKAGCIDTSKCEFIFTGSIQETLFEKVKTYPNPTSGKLDFDFGDFTNFYLKIFDSKGKLIKDFGIIESRELTYYIEGSDGLYLIELRKANSRKIIEVIKGDF